MRPLMVARTTRPLSHFTRNIALGSASWTTPSNSSLSPFGSFLSRRSLIPEKSPQALLSTPSALPEGLEDSLRNFRNLTDPVDSPQQALLLVVREELRGHL